MNPSLLQVLRCTSGCRNELELHAAKDAGDEKIISGFLRCTDCGREYQIDDGIVRMLPESLCGNCLPQDELSRNAAAQKLSEMQARDAQVEDYDRMWYLNLFGKLEIPLTLSHLTPRKSHMLLEAGCGTGRMTRTFANKCRRLVSADFSLESLKACSGKLNDAGIDNVDLIQADICHLPLSTSVFDRVVSCQVLEHIPTPESRACAVSELSRVMKDNGKLVLSAYQHSVITRLFGEKEGQHDGGIYFYRFARKELKALLSRTLEVETIT
ncbi:MAG TPA: methyltransferase domain-containing protein, partial [Armatimonadota bacterium]